MVIQINFLTLFGTCLDYVKEKTELKNTWIEMLKVKHTCISIYENALICINMLMKMGKQQLLSSPLFQTDV